MNKLKQWKIWMQCKSLGSILNLKYVPMKTSLVVIISTPAATLGREGEDYKFKANVVCQLRSGSTWETYCTSISTTHTQRRLGI